MILLLGLDAWDARWAAPLRAVGFHTAPLRSPYAMSGPGWNSIMSGLRAETHGYAGQPAVGDGPPLPSNPNRPPYVWDHLQATGKESIVINVPFIWPPTPTRLMVCGYPSPPDLYTFPKAARVRWPHGDLDLIGYDYAANRQTWPQWRPDEYVAKARHCRWAMAHRLRVELAQGLPALAVFCLTDLDRLAHLLRGEFVRHQATLLADLATLAAQLAGNCGAEWTLVVSDHGCQPNPTGWHTHSRELPGTELGMFAWLGPGAADLPPGTVVELEDVLPTILWLADVSPVYPVEGRARTGIAPPAVDETALRNRLAALGYVDA